MLKKYIVAALASTFIISTPALAEDVVRELDEVSVTATRLARKTSETSASVAVVTEEDIKDSKMANIKEVLSGIPGVLIDTKNQGYDSRLIIRGAGLKARYGVREIMVLLDGVPVTDPDSFTRLDLIDTQLIERIEVVKGPNSTLWGANAAGGVINIISKNPLKRAGGNLKVGIGSNSTYNAHLSYTGSIGDKWFYSASGSHRETENSWRRWNKFDTNQFSLQPYLVLDDGTTWENKISYSKADLQLAGSLNETMFKEYERTGKALETDGQWQYSGRYSESLFFSSKLSKDIGDFKFIPMLFANVWNHHHPVTGRINDSDTYTFGADIQLNHDHKMAGMQGTLTTGFTGRFDNQETDYYKYADVATVTAGWPPAAQISKVLSDRVGSHLENQVRETFLWGIYAQESIRPNDRWIIDMGIRFDKVNFDISGIQTGEYSWAKKNYIDYASPVTYAVDKSYDAFSPRIGANYKLNNKVNLYGSISTGVQTPTEGEITDNPELKLVKVNNYEVGVKAGAQQWFFEGSFYYSPVEDEVVQINQSGVTEYVNAGETLKKGFEFSGTYYLTDEFSLGTSYAFTDYKFEEFSEAVRSGAVVNNIDRSGNTLPFVPEHKYSFFASYKHPSGLKCKVQTHTWGEYYMDNANTEKYEGYDFVTNAMIGYETGNWDLAVNIDNVFDKKYAVEVKKDTSGYKTFVPAAPMTVMARVSYSF